MAKGRVLMWARTRASLANFLLDILLGSLAICAFVLIITVTIWAVYAALVNTGIIEGVCSCG